MVEQGGETADRSLIGDVVLLLAASNPGAEIGLAHVGYGLLNPRRILAGWCHKARAFDGLVRLRSGEIAAADVEIAEKEAGIEGDATFGFDNRLLWTSLKKKQPGVVAVNPWIARIDGEQLRYIF